MQLPWKLLKRLLEAVGQIYIEISVSKGRLNTSGISQDALDTLKGLTALRLIPNCPSIESLIRARLFWRSDCRSNGRILMVLYNYFMIIQIKWFRHMVHGPPWVNQRWFSNTQWFHNSKIFGMKMSSGHFASWKNWKGDLNFGMV